MQVLIYIMYLLSGAADWTDSRTFIHTYICMAYNLADRVALIWVSIALAIYRSIAHEPLGVCEERAK
mgnify:CR=1 FL=1|jgi:hypothetical protein